MSDPKHGPTEPDRSTIDACRRGDRAALTRVFAERTARLQRLLTRLAGPGPEVEDLLQITVVAAISAFPKFRGEASLDTWLTRIAINAYRTHVRRERERMRVPLELLPSAAEPHDPKPSPEHIAGDRQRLDRIYKHLDALSSPKRIAFLLHTACGFSVDEVAALTGASRFATKSRIFWAGRVLRGRARKDPMLRELIDDSGKGEA